MATAHSHNLPAGPALTAAARSAVLASGEQWTDLRAQVFDALATFDRPASAYDVTEVVSKAAGPITSTPSPRHAAIRKRVPVFWGMSGW